MAFPKGIRDDMFRPVTAARFSLGHRSGCGAPEVLACGYRPRCIAGPATRGCGYAFRRAREIGLRPNWSRRHGCRRRLKTRGQLKRTFWAVRLAELAHNRASIESDSRLCTGQCLDDHSERPVLHTQSRWDSIDFAARIRQALRSHDGVSSQSARTTRSAVELRVPIQICA